MSYIWRFFDFLALPRPNYRSDERPISTVFTSNGTTPRLTLYRVLVSASVTLFCTGKATLAFLGYTATANQLDWLVGVVLTTMYATYRLGVSSCTHYLQILRPGSL